MPTCYWHPFADMHRVREHELVLARGAGAWIEDVDGRRYLDATAGLWYCNVGHGRAEIAAAAAAQLETLAAYSNFGPFATGPTLELADRLAALAPMEGTSVFFGSGGSDAVDTAAKLARRYWDALGHREKRIVVSREHAYHGMHAFGTGLAGIPLNREGYGGPIVGDTIQVGAHDIDELERLFRSRGREIAAFIGEPVIGAGGVIPPEDGYWEAITQLCDAHGVLLVADEVVTGFGRLGTMFGSERYGIAPDMITFAKGVTSGYLPLGGVLIGRRVAEPFWEGASGPVFRHGYTYSGHATACAAALANLDIVEREGLVARVRDLEPVLAREIARLDAAPLVGETRVVGLTAAVELEEETLAANPGAAEVVVASARRHGILTRVLRGVALQVSPPFVITEDEIRRMVDGFEAALAEVAAA
ncbi:MAG: aminotransferase class III-fold pyridoxal phosphate-dependent enzyme [Chloroflexi bacterium]|nr:aminotransferase class III-fold pyridoxal phosphate-dependent enzyme [Chloroflexota bacterium]